MMKKTIIVFLFLLCVGLVINNNSIAETYTVTSATDTGSDTGTTGKLSWAIAQSNATSAVDDTIVFDLMSGSTVTISAALPVITDTVTINGNDAGSDITVQVTIPGTSAFNVFHIDASGETVNINNMTIKGGDVSDSTYNGGGIYIEGGTLSLDYVIVSGAKAYYGGGIDVGPSCTLTLTDSTLSGNSATQYGGGIGAHSSATVTLTNSTLSNNSADNNAGGIYANSSTVTLTNSTLSGNSSNNIGGGIFTQSSSNITLINSTLSGNRANNGGGIYASSSSSVTLTDSIVAYNYLVNNSGYNDIAFYSSTIYGNHNISGYDLSGSGSGNIAYTYTSGRGDTLFDQYEEIVADTIYKSTLADNGGATQTVALAEDSIAIGSGVRTGTYDDSGTTKYAFHNGTNWVKVEDGSTVITGVTEITTDQRGIARNGVPDIGAYEYVGSPPVPEMNLKQGTTDIADGGNYDFSSHAAGTDTDVVFTIENTGTADLTLSGTPIVTITGTDASQFSVQGAQPTSPVAASGSTTFTVRFSPTSTGAKTASIAIVNNDSDENLYNLTLNATGTVGILSYVKVRDAAGGTGAEVDTHSMNAAETFTVYSAGYDQYGNYISDQSVTWTSAGVCVGNLSPAIGTSTTFTAAAAGDGTITADHATVTDDTTGTITVSAGAAATFAVTTQHSGTETAGTAFSVTLIAKDADNNTVTGYTGDHSLTWTWTATISPDATVPAKPADGNQTFTAGVATVSGFTLTNSGETPTITATAGSVTGTSAAITVNDGVLNHVKIRDAAGDTGTEVDTHSMSEAETFTVYAAGYDQYGNYISDQSAAWTGTGVCVGNLSPTTGTATVFTAVTAGTGTIGIEDYGSVTGDATGTITVDANPPVVTTAAVSSITATTAQSGGNVTSNGGSAITYRGVCWSTSADPITADSHTTDGTGTGTFTSSMTGLLANTEYHVRAYATSAASTTYGDEESFTTESDGTGVTPGTQDAGPNGGDGNGDGVLDSKQTTVASLPSATGEGYLTVEISGCDQIEQVQPYTYGSVGANDTGYSYPFGLVGFEIPCSSATVRIYYHGSEGLEGYTYRKYGPTPADWGISRWYAMPGVTFGTKLIGGIPVPYVEFTLTESQLGDDTLGPPIIDQGGIALRDATIPTLNEWGMIILLLLTITAALMMIRRRRA